MYYRLYYHMVWTTKDRSPGSNKDVAVFWCRFLRSIAIQERGRVLEIGMISDHVHVLLTVHPATNWGRLVQRMKGGSSMVANREGRSNLGTNYRGPKDTAFKQSVRAMSNEFANT
jgi:REP element-mobilizing transposase RayT